MMPKLSICIATYNRARYIGETLESILPQLTDDVELIIVDGASPDETPQVVARYQHPSLRYVRETTNSGVDRDYDKAISYARGEFCWLMTDDDLMVEHAVQCVLSRLGNELDLVVVNAEVRNKDLSAVLRPTMLRFDEDRTYDDPSGESVFVDVAGYLTFIGGVVVRRSWWLQRQREPYYGSLFIHIGALFQAPAVRRVHVVARPLLIIRFGNAMWTARSFEIWMFKWPGLVWSFEQFSAAARKAVCPPRPFLSAKRLLWHRAVGSYTTAEYRQHLVSRGTVVSRAVASVIAHLPGKVANFICALYYLLRRSNPAKLELYDLLRSAYVTALARRVAQARHVA